MNILIAILALNLIVILHELGHYLVAKAAGISVLEFSLFFGPKLFSTKKGETTFSLRLFPVGAYVLLEGEEEASDSERSFSKKPLAVRMAVVAGGPVMNFLGALVFICVVFAVIGYSSMVLGPVPPGSPAAEAGLMAGDRILRYDGRRVYQPSDLYSFMAINNGKPSVIQLQRGNEKKQVLFVPDVIPAERYVLGFGAVEPYGEESTLVQYIVPGSPAEESGLLPGDRIIRLDGQPVSTKKEISRLVQEKQDQPITVTVLRAGREETLRLTPRLEKGATYFDTGFSFQTLRGGSGTILKQGVVYIYAVIRSVVYSFGWLLTGKVSLTELAGPVRIVSIMSEAVSYSPTLSLILLNLLNISALISIAIGATNLLPLPALDGGRLLLYVFEAVRGKPLSPEREASISMVGFALLMVLAVFVLFNDIIQLVRG
ncbi:MAG TPA: RIP metalloprotease RseP [Firmicutes bacterium]|uniref:Zinc metalloprotease n=1 Tax=Capillibacterium thermochitinicola TaxID=2699427 RepID=A0A8J6I1V2_9FIRM|nr:RIP metalloprotease RseP [Capillibacterium thermochitinicola]MBA2133723.1 RIP metalloprotease RseP [Capillibacterium thermochitinicola]HHW11887.1 RIP metalloprotease RseP [Bacillota bacterium]